MWNVYVFAVVILYAPSSAPPASGNSFLNITLLLQTAAEMLLPLRVNFHCGVIVTCEHEIEAMYEKPLVNVKVKRGSTFMSTFTLHKFPLFYYCALARDFHLRRHVNCT